MIAYFATSVDAIVFMKDYMCLADALHFAVVCIGNMWSVPCVATPRPAVIRSPLT